VLVDVRTRLRTSYVFEAFTAEEIEFARRERVS
jgi:hypothetical protein